MIGTLGSWFHCYIEGRKYLTNLSQIRSNGEQRARRNASALVILLDPATLDPDNRVVLFAFLGGVINALPVP
jgi:hypothetical protein